jgi:hypothetical protein
MVIRLGCTLPHNSSSLPGSLASHSHRDEQPLDPYLALLRRGFGLPRLSPDARCALTAPFHPYPRHKGCVLPRDLTGHPKGQTHKAGGIFSVPLSLDGFAARSPLATLLLYRARTFLFSELKRPSEPSTMLSTRTQKCSSGRVAARASEDKHSLLCGLGGRCANSLLAFLRSCAVQPARVWG